MKTTETKDLFWGEEKREGIPIAKDLIIRDLFNLTELGDECIKAVIPDIGPFEKKEEVQKEIGSPPKNYVSFDYYRQSENYIIDLEIQYSPDSNIVTRANHYMAILLNRVFELYGEDKKKAVVIVFLNHWQFEKKLLVKTRFNEVEEEKVRAQVYYVNLQYHGTKIDSYLYRLCMDFQRAQKGQYEKLETKIIHDVVEYLIKEGGHNNIMKEYDKLILTATQNGKAEERQEVVLTMCKDPSFTDAQIAKIGKIPVSQVLALRRKLAEAKQN